MNDWLWTYEGFDPAEEGLREALCTLGNGYFATRGALPESQADDVHYPGTYIAGVYNRLASDISDRRIENESLVNAPNWLLLTFRTDDGAVFSTSTCDVLSHHLDLDLRRGLLTRRSRLREPAGRILDITQRRFVSLRDMHLAGLETTVVAENWSGTLQVCSGIDGTVTNSGVARYRDLPGDHLVGVIAHGVNHETVCLEVETSDSHVRIAVSARTCVFRDRSTVDVPREVESFGRYVAQHFTLDLREGEEVTIEKSAALFTSHDEGIYEPHIEAEDWASDIAGRFEELLERHVVSWRHVWHRARVDLNGHRSTARILNLHLFHLLQTVSKNTAELDVGVPARGLHGEAYRGHIFWDELYILPFLTWRVPELTRALLRYRASRLDAARRNASAAGYTGAMYPWQSASNGREETQSWHLNPKSGRWLPDASRLQRHINAAIAFGTWHYWEVTRDHEFMSFWGAEMMLEIGRFWSSIAIYNHTLDRYEIRGVMGPDEFHEGYPDTDEPGLDNNTYTNLMAVWCLCRAFDVLAVLPEMRRVELTEKLSITEEELDRWGDVSRKMRVCFHDGVMSQFEGYELLQELDWEDYRTRYGNIQRLDRILEAEGDSPNRYKVAKQADVLMLFYLFPAEKLQALLERLGYDYDPELIPRTIDYYEPRTSHGSTLSVMVHSWLHARRDRARSWDLFRRALHSDVDDVQGGTTPEGIHLGAMAGTVDLVQRCYTGLDVDGDVLRLDPALPEELSTLTSRIRFRGVAVELHFTQQLLTASVAPDAQTPIEIEIKDQRGVVHPGETFAVDL